MKVISVFKSDPASRDGEVPDEKTMAAMGQLIEEMFAAGVLVDTGGVLPGGLTMRVRRSGSAVTVVDGPFTETKELVGGFAVLNVDSKEEAISWTRRFLEISGDGVCEMHEVTSVQ